MLKQKLCQLQVWVELRKKGDITPAAAQEKNSEQEPGSYREGLLVIYHEIENLLFGSLPTRHIRSDLKIRNFGRAQGETEDPRCAGFPT